MGAGFRYGALGEYKDSVGFHQRRNSVRNDDRGNTAAPLLQRSTDALVCAGVYSGQGVIEDQNVTVLSNGTGDGHALFLPAGQGNAAFSDDGIIAR